MVKDGRVINMEFKISCTVDFPDDVMMGPFDYDLLEKIITSCVHMGVTRINWLYYGDADTDSYWGGGLFYHPFLKHGRETLDNIGEPLKAAVSLAHKHGLEIYGVLKPYETGESGTYPEGSPDPKFSSMARIGGRLWQPIRFVEQYPYTRLRRRNYRLPSNLENMEIRKIRLIKKDASPTRIKKENLQIWTSPDNYQYKLLNVPFSFVESIERSTREIRDYYGEIVTAIDDPILVLTLDELNLKDSFVLITTDFTDTDGDFENTAIGMIEAYSDLPEPLPIVVANRSALWGRPRDFRTFGLEFDSGFGTLRVNLDDDNRNIPSWISVSQSAGADEGRSDVCGGIIAFARGKNEYVPAMVCEAYPEVRKLWSGWVDRILATGVDGIDLRVSAHGNIVDEPWEYGFNDIVLDEYVEEHSETTALSDQEISKIISQIRGRHYTDFVRETSRKARAIGKKMQVHMHTEAFRSNPVHGQIMGFPPHVRFEWQNWLKEKLVDSIILRTSWFEGWEDPPEGNSGRSKLSNMMKDSVVDEVLALSNELDVPAYLNRYVDRAVGIEEYLVDMETAINDVRLSGFDIYEFAALALATTDGTRLEPVADRIEKITDTIRKL